MVRKLKAGFRQPFFVFMQRALGLNIKHGI